MPMVTLKQKRQTSSSCQNGAFYKSPARGDKIDMGGASSTSVHVAWDTSCLNPAPDLVDIYLLSPGVAANLGQITVWTNVPHGLGQFDVQVDSNMWNSTAAVDLQVQIIQTGTPIFLSQMAAGPVFQVVNPNPTTSNAAANSVTGASSTSLSNIWHDYGAIFAKHGLSRGQLAASIVVPILFACFAIAGYVFFSRRRQARKRTAWKTETDKRMSMVSADWQSMSAAGGAAAVRGSFQTNRTPRGSMHTMRTQSILGLDGGVAPSPLRAGFASEDISQLGPRARALSAAAAEGRPLSRLVNEKAHGAHDASPRIRSKSTAALDAVPPSFGSRADGRGRTKSASGAVALAITAPVHPPLPGAYTGRTPDDARRASTASSNPFAEAMAKRDSLVHPTHGYSPAPGMAFPVFPGSSTPVTDSAQQRARVDSQGRLVDDASRTRVASRVSFADVLNERGRTQSTLSRGRLMGTSTSAHDEYGLEMQDALPALALMRTQSGHDGVAFPSSDGGHVLGARALYISPVSPEYSPGSGSRGSGVGSYFGSAPFAEQGESPDEALRRIAAQRRDSMRESEESRTSGIFGSLRRGLNRFRN